MRLVALPPLLLALHLHASMQLAMLVALAMNPAGGDSQGGDVGGAQVGSLYHACCIRHYAFCNLLPSCMLHVSASIMLLWFTDGIHCLAGSLQAEQGTQAVVHVSTGAGPSQQRLSVGVDNMTGCLDLCAATAFARCLVGKCPGGGRASAVCTSNLL